MQTSTKYLTEDLRSKGDWPPGLYLCLSPGVYYLKELFGR